MRNNNRQYRGAVLLVTCALLVTSASAMTVSFGGKIAANGDGMISRFTDRSGPVIFDDFRNSSGGCGINDTAVGSEDGGHRSPVVTESGPGKSAYYSDSVQGVRLNPQSGGQCFGVINDEANYIEGNGDPIRAGYTDFGPINHVGLMTYWGVPLTYFGFVWGSPDSYNYVQFIDGVGHVISSISISGLNIAAPGTISGSDIYHSAYDGGFNSDPGNAGSQYVNFKFDPSDFVYGVRFGQTSNCCFEFANVAVSVDAVVTDPTPGVGIPTSPPPPPTASPSAQLVTEPGSAATAIIGLGLIAAIRRRAQCR